MNGFNSANDTSGHFEKIGGTTMFHASPHDTRKSMIAGQNALCVMAEISQWCTNNACDSNVHEAKVSNVLAKERATKVHHESDEKNEVRVGKKAGDWTQPAKHVPINCFFET